LIPSVEYDSQPPRPDELRGLADDVDYEMFMFTYLARSLTSAQTVEQNALREAMLIHARCLMDFFACRPQKDDVVACHYVTWDPVADGAKELEWLKANLHTFINKRVAHITAYRQRVSKDQDAQFVAEVDSNVATLVDRFRVKLDARDLGWFPRMRQTWASQADE
jgi:hypothetical protein